MWRWRVYTPRSVTWYYILMKYRSLKEPIQSCAPLDHLSVVAVLVVFVAVASALVVVAGVSFVVACAVALVAVAVLVAVLVSVLAVAVAGVVVAFAVGVAADILQPFFYND